MLFVTHWCASPLVFPTSISFENSCIVPNGRSWGGSPWDLPGFIRSPKSHTGVCDFKGLVMGSSSSVSLPRVPWLSHPPVKRDMDDSPSFVGLQDPGVKLSDGSDMFKFSHSRSAQSNSLGKWPLSGVRGDESAGGLSAVSVVKLSSISIRSRGRWPSLWGFLDVTMRQWGWLAQHNFRVWQCRSLKSTRTKSWSEGSHVVVS